MRLEGRVTIVTGGASGIGASVCERFAAEGASVVVVDRDGEGAAKRAANLGRAEAMCVDICDVAAVNDCVAAVVASYGRLDVLANIAGVDDPAAKDLVRQQMSDGQPLDITSTLSDEQWHRMLSINLNGTFYFLRAALRQMLPRRSGSIINMSSLAGVVGVAGIPHYSAAKAAIIGLTQSVAKEVGDRGVRVNAIAPGGTRTPMTGRSPKGLGPGTGIPMGRFAEPEEVASVIAFLASDDSSYLTGETINVNGGMITV